MIQSILNNFFNVYFIFAIARHMGIIINMNIYFQKYNYSHNKLLTLIKIMLPTPLNTPTPLITHCSSVAACITNFNHFPIIVFGPSANDQWDFEVFCRELVFSNIFIRFYTNKLIYRETPAELMREIILYDDFRYVSDFLIGTRFL